MLNRKKNWTHLWLGVTFDYIFLRELEYKLATFRFFSFLNKVSCICFSILRFQLAFLLISSHYFFYINSKDKRNQNKEGKDTKVNWRVSNS